jgi:hypothetical protein
MGTLDQVARVGVGMRLVDVPAKKSLDAIPRCPVNQRFMLAGIGRPTPRARSTASTSTWDISGFSIVRISIGQPDYRTVTVMTAPQAGDEPAVQRPTAEVAI